MTGNTWGTTYMLIYRKVRNQSSSFFFFNRVVFTFSLASVKMYVLSVRSFISPRLTHPTLYQYAEITQLRHRPDENELLSMTNTVTTDLPLSIFWPKQQACLWICLPAFAEITFLVNRWTAIQFTQYPYSTTAYHLVAHSIMKAWSVDVSNHHSNSTDSNDISMYECGLWHKSTTLTGLMFR